MILLLLSRLMPAHPAAHMLKFTDIHRFGWKKKRSQAMRCCFQRAQRSCVRVWAVHGHGISEPTRAWAAKSLVWWRNVIFGANCFLLCGIQNDAEPPTQQPEMSDGEIGSGSCRNHLPTPNF